MECINPQSVGLEKNVSEVNCSRTISGTSFPQGVMDYSFQVGAPSAFKWSDVYFRVAVSLTLPGGVRQPGIHTSDVALSDGFVSSLFNQIDVKAGGVSISSLTRYVGQASQLRTRLCKSSAWQKSVGRNTFFIEPSFKEREKITSYDDGVITYSGTVSIDGDGVVTGTDTDFWNDGVKTGMILNVDGESYVITGVVPGSDTFLQIQVPEGFTSLTDESYTVNTEIDRAAPSDGRNSIYVMWQPGLGIFDSDEWIGAGQYMVSLNPSANYQTAAIQTLTSSNDPDAPEYRLIVDDIRMYVPTYKMSIPDSILPLSLTEIDVQSRVINDTGNVSSLQFTVPASTYGLVVFLQAGEAGYDTICPTTLFRTLRSYPPNPDVKGEKSLQNIQITYANISRPSINWTNAEFTEDNTVAASNSTNQLQQRYFDTITESGMIHNVGGVESFEDYLERGVMVYYKYLKDANNQGATDVQLSANFASNLPANTRLFLCALHTKIVEVTTQRGLVVQVRQKAV